ncbi:Piso0_002480 [Millerozyma farinosa CBS 7064]|uniref:Postreplication repair E3 ubiquitin-protein ligase RAD18 n=1 Tax=Pichia sorbitophila (strain ATCC MYA-4447 / BCRC 22081 / CBS 7064 / NBRC 10061 / NRRL Y-12695) TaxID=559304 RepID=G8YF59_PICSO|nr:Piso0_002480 [Millerozyma farinosa CBS 7064]
MSSNPFSKNLESVSDPSDWNKTKVQGLRELDSLQRCYICKEFLKAPVMTSCNHTFCSQCIREYLLSNTHCPLCKSEQLESNLKKIVLLEELVLCFKKYRPILLELLANGKSDEADDPEAYKEINDPQATANDNNSINQDIIEIPDDDVGTSEGEPPLKKRLSDKKQSVDSTLPKNDDLVECPICSELMSAEKLQTLHIDQCLNGKSNSSHRSDSTRSSNSSKSHTLRRKNSPKKTNAISSFFRPVDSSVSDSKSRSVKNAPTPSENQPLHSNDIPIHHLSDRKRLPKLDFSSLTTPRLKDKLAALSLPTYGSRVQLESRYNQYYILFNSNLDSNHPLSDKVLRHKLSQWEHSHSTFSNTSLFNTKSPINFKSITDKDFPVKLWLRTYKSDFKELVEKAKSTNKKKQEPPESSLTTDSNNTEVQLASENLRNGNDNQKQSHSDIPDTVDNMDINKGIENSSLFVFDDSQEIANEE